jgi:hypothetical protein
LLLGQEIAPEILVPLALDLLEQNLCLESDLYPGDLLVAVLSQRDKFWLDNDDLHLRASEVCRGLEFAFEATSKARESLKFVGCR